MMNPVQTANGPTRPRLAFRERPAFLPPSQFNLLMFGGKGGVGKTTCATATALHLAERFPDCQYLLVSTDPAHSLQDCLAGVTCPANLQVRELDARESLRRFQAAHRGHLRLIATRGTFLDDDDITGFLDLSLPGLDELMAFIELSELAQNESFASVIVDTAPTGHTLRLLALPRVLRQWLAALDALLAKHRYLAGLYHRRHSPDDADRFLTELEARIEALASLLVDHERCRFVPVMLAESLVSAETVRLIQALRDLRIPVTDIVVNAVYPTNADCLLCAQTRRWQMAELRRVTDALADYPLWCVPLRQPELNGCPRLTDFWDDLQRARPAVDDRATSPTPLALHRMPSPRVEHPLPLPARDMRLIFLAGKGGVGKTTMASATAVRLARQYRDRNILLLSTDPAHSLADCFQTPIGPHPVQLIERLSAVEIDAEADLAELKQQYTAEVAEFFERLTGPAAGLDLSFDREVAARLLDLSPPGIDEVMALAHVIQLLEAGTYDLLVCDTAPTGHLIRLLEMPALLEQWFRALFGLLLKYRRILRLPRVAERLVTLSKELKALRVLLSDPHRGKLYAVALPSTLAVAETEDLLAACRATGIPVAGLFVNMVRPRGNCPLCDAVVRQETDLLTRFQSLSAGARPVVVYRGAPPCGLARLSELGQTLYREGRA